MASVATCMAMAAKHHSVRAWRVVTWEMLMNHGRNMVAVYESYGTSDKLTDVDKHTIMFLVGCMLLDMQRADFNMKETDMVRVQKCMKRVVGDVSNCRSSRLRLCRLLDQMQLPSPPQTRVLGKLARISMRLSGSDNNIKKT